MPSVLEVTGLTVAFGAHTVLEALSFCVEQGESLAVIGPNGSGKTVLFRALVGVIPCAGKIAWAPGTRIGYVPQKLDIERDLPLTGRDLIAAKLGVAKGAAAESVIRDLQLGPEVAAPIGALSGGQFQRLLLGIALIGDPTVLLLDEPTAGVDQPSHAHIHEYLGRLQRERRITLLFISHELNVVSALATRVLCLSRRRAWIGPPRSILTPERLSEAYGMPVHYHVHDD